ncbi:MAG: arsenic efflux protein [Candidatus Nealsonbacteria bacterium]|nr:arsenic efflux protein [Candidatus Nealsonbacteria bacterium]
MFQVFSDAITDTVKMIPLLLVIYIAIELIEYKFGNKIREKIQKAGALGPAVGSTVGSFPQCGFSVVVTALYTQRLVTIGTLLAVYLSTSDEAIPIILSQPDRANIILPLILTKIFIALIAGYAVDFAFRKTNKETLTHIKAFAKGLDDGSHHHESIMEEKACCGHSASPSAKKFNPKEIFFHPIIHTAKIFVFIFIISLSINVIIFEIGEEALGKFFLTHSILQPFISALAGLIPNCAASVVITELYLKGAITYGSVISGLCASGGLGILVLFKEEKDKKNIFKVLFLLFGISVTAGLIIQYFF